LDGTRTQLTGRETQAHQYQAKLNAMRNHPATLVPLSRQKTKVKGKSKKATTFLLLPE